MKKRKNTVAKVVAFIALLSILIGVIGTGMLVIFSNPVSEQQISAQQIQEYIDSLSGSSLSGSELELNLSGSLSGE